VNARVCWCCGGNRAVCDCDIYFESNGGADEYCAAHERTWLTPTLSKLSEVR
jgi:hypothetical protein